MRNLVLASLFCVAALALSLPTLLVAAESDSTPDSTPDSAPAAATLNPAQQLAYWFEQAGLAWQEQDTENWVKATEKLHELRPHNQDFMRQLVEGYSQLSQLDKAFEMMLNMQQQGLHEKWDEIDAVEPLREHRLYAYLNDLMQQAGEPFGEASLWSSIPAEHAMPEALAVDPDSGRVFVGTVRGGEILVSEDDGKSWKLFASPETVAGMSAIFSLAVDAERGYLWVASGKVGQYQGKAAEDLPRSVLLRLDLATGKLEESYAPGNRRGLIGSLAVAADGTVFAADTQAPLIYRLEPGEERISLYFAHPNLTSLRGIALNGNDTLLYVADYEMGVLVLDATGGQQAWQLAAPKNFNIGGIDGLFWLDDHLVVIQNAISPQRVMRLTLGADGLGVTAVAPLAASLKEFDTPTFGALKGSELYFFAASHWPHVGPQGQAEEALAPIPVMKLDVLSASVQTVGEGAMQQLMRQN